ncbi:MAG: sulfotransferase [bacterium]|nr:sulfotransferase [bacterium]
MANLPHFIHIGFPKTASTWLQDLFAAHQDICFAYKPKFFHWDDCFSKGKDFYLSLFKPKSGNKISLDSDEQYSAGFRYRSFGWDCCHEEKRSEGFGKAVQKFAMPMDNELIAKRIHQTVPDAKILIVIRNQADWLASVYKHFIRGREELRAFSKFIKEDAFVKVGFYSAIVDLYFKLFGRGNVLVLFYEELLSNPENFLDKISDFFGIDKFDHSRINTRAKVSLTNRGAKILRIINFAARKFPWVARPIFYLDRKFLSRLNDSKFISDKDREYLANLYAEDNKKLAELLGRPNLYT